MSTYINCGAYLDGRRCPSKKALKEALANAPDSVVFDGTAMFGQMPPDHVRDLRSDEILSVVGPDPYTSRKWYASVTRDASGKVRCT